MDALTKALVSVLRHLERIEARVSTLEAAQGILPQVAQAFEAAPAPEAAREAAPMEAAPEPAAPVEPPPSLAAFEPASARSAPPAESDAEPAPGIETRVGLTWINRVAVITLIFFAAFFFKYAVDNQWIGEGGRVALGVIAGFATLAWGELLSRRGHRTYAQGITATGLSVLYLSFFASFGFYHLVPQAAAFLLMALTSAMAGVLAIRYGALPISILALIGGYLTPLLLSTGEDRPWVLFGYLVLLNAGALWVAHAERWRSLEFLSLTATILLCGTWLAERLSDEKQLVATFFALAFYALFAVARSPVVLAVIQVFANIAIVAISPSEDVVYLALLLALAAAGLWLAERSGRSGTLLTPFGAFWAGAAIWQMHLWRPEQLGAILLILSAGFLTFLGRVAWRLLMQRAEVRRQDLVIVALNGGAYFGICYHLLLAGYKDWLGLFAAALAGMHLALAMWVWKQQPAERRDTRPVLLLIGVALTFLTLAAPIQFSGYRITMAWAVEAAALAWIGKRAGSGRLVYCSLAVFAITLIRLHSIDAWIYFDAGAYHLIANARFLTFAVSVACLWLSAYWTLPGATGMAPYLGGHFVLAWALVMEVIGWAERTASAANVANVASVAVSILLAAYGVLLVGTGVATRLGINRILGLGLLAALVAKLYLYDVWQLEKIYRVAAFGVLGALLLATSYLYSRYRSVVERWWRDENRNS